MAKILFNLGRWSYLHKKRVIAAWLLLFVGIAAAALGFQKGFNDVFEIKDVPSTHATEMLQEKFPGTKNPAESTDVNIVFGAPEGKKLEDPELMAAMDETVASLRNNVPDFKEGMQFGKGFGGFGGILRYKVAFDDLALYDEQEDEVMSDDEDIY